MPADFYVLLNITRSADLEEIRRAFRTLLLARGPEDAVELRAAYETLSDPGLRAAYDRELELVPAECDPLRRRPGRRTVLPAVHLFDSFRTHRPATDHLSRLIAQNFTGLGMPKSQPRHPVHIDVILDPVQAASGGHLPLHIPVPSICARCSGTGRAGSAECELCQGQGSTWRAEELDVLIPARVSDNTTVPVSLGHLGIRNLHLVLHLRVAHGTA